MEEKKKRGNYKVKALNKIKLMAYYKEINKGNPDKLGENNGKRNIQ